MCGIVGYIGPKNAYPILINGLKRLEYRGYDSAGIAIFQNNNIEVLKKKGKVAELEQFCETRNTYANIGIAHTRWATHGEPNDINAHPHNSMNGLFTIIHNGIIENYEKLKKDLSLKGYHFYGQTDSEILANLIEYMYSEGDHINAEQAVRMALTRVVGAYGLVVMCKNEPDKLIAARKSSPLAIGIGSGEYFIASDATPIIEYTKSVVYLNDDDVAVISKDSFTLKTVQHDVEIKPEVLQLELSIGEIEKNGFEHFMLKEIFEQPKTITDSFRGRIDPQTKEVVLGGLSNVMPRLLDARRIIIIACGTSWHAALIGEYLIEEYAQVPVEVEYASEYRYRKPIIRPDDVVLAISQSGETADTLAAIRLAKEKGALVLGICNVVGSSISRETDAGIYTHAGVEIGVASTKAFTAQVTVLTLLAMRLARKHQTIADERYYSIINDLLSVPDKIEDILRNHLNIKKIAQKYYNSINSLYLGRGYLFPVALEGALKLKEISYIHAEGYAAGEMKHGPIALIDSNLPVVVVAAKDRYYEKIVSNIQEVKARKGNIIAVITEGDSNLRNMVEDIIEIPKSDDVVTPFLAIIPLQLLAYYIAVLRGCDVDQPRNLAKSVTVE
ncbi:MAG TPA: glutamine--fructose-6-phosphate transaminase (isomerizing) [Prolixibacteraceae bacterium]|nr:glutamine--fructose-6-phosphate transaminase (isomerizing) [Prolixibacteraceae bacterium]HPR59569.1 glutamine--fructose-6-phosphate transaminase (isomerizing) [Prolixibacteraceae bacterium]